MTRTTTDPTGARPQTRTGTTTEVPAGGPDPVTVARTRRTVSVRTRITATVTALVTLALAGAGLVVYVVESDRIDERVVSESQQELDEYVQSRRLQTSGPADLASDLAEFLADNVPDDDELLVAEVEGGPQRFTPASARADGALADPGVRAAIDELTRTGGSTRLETAQGPVLVNSQAVEGGGERGALLVITFLADARAELRETIGTYAVVSVLSLLLIGGVASWQSGRLLRPLRTVRETAEEITGTDLSRRLPVRGNDDVTALTRTVNDMLDRLEAAHLRQRQLLDDAGHELRTPLTVLSGHLELLDHTDAAEVDQTRDLLLGEVDRMSRLVGDLILLAKTDRPDFLDARPVEVGRLTEVVLAKARVLGPRRWTLDDHAEGTAVLDEQRITQALLQLVDNAVKHTRDGDVVALGSRRVPGAVELWVRDTGLGVPVEDRDRIFERFGRGAVRADDEGFGLGLAIVDAIARAHGGELRLDHTYVDGARFTLRLPGD